jgi:alkanesulfonate monooxygenase SsuD/methylene tetrahydromethanopterin reductase-like flavin-dependent oxidoreductase (luciferase family)
MKFGLIYELQMLKPWSDTSESDTYWQAIEQIVVAEEAGFDYVWAVEHHFLTEYSHCSAPEVFLAAVAQHTERIRIGHGVVLLPPPFNHPARVAERVAALDIVSKGRVEFGTGRSITEAELGGFGIDPSESRPMWEEALHEIPKMWTEEVYPGHQGTYFSMPPRQVIPKPVQKPHPPIWMACTQPESFAIAGRKGIGVLAFGIGGPGAVQESVSVYRKEVACPAEQVGRFKNDQVAAATLLYCSEDRDEADRYGMEAALWFWQKTAELFTPWRGRKVSGYEYYTDFTSERNIVSDIASVTSSEARQRAMCIGTPERVLSGIKAYEEAGIDQVIGLVQVGRIPHEKILASIQLMGKEVIPEFRR